MRETVAEFVSGRGAHITFGQAVDGFPPARAGERVEGVAHTVWTLVWHMKEAIQDIIDYVEEPASYEPKPYPSGYWPDSYGPPDEEAWRQKVAEVEEAIATVRGWVTDETKDLMAPIPGTPGHTLFRQALLVVDHNSYHIGQIVDLRMLLGIPVKDW
ncbi:MAG: DinB family protein [Spirochaetaceae bacterium]